MKIEELQISFGGYEWLLTNYRAIYWEYERALILSDLHLGKATYFRQNGIPMPATVGERDLSRLQTLIVHYRPLLVVIVGDFVHAGGSKETNLFGKLSARHADTRFILVKGNHDRIRVAKLLEWGVSECVETWQSGGILFSHHPVNGDLPTISGHLHPGVRITLPHKGVVKLPCYAVMGNQLVLPAFSLFTGLDTRSIPNHADRYAISEDRIFKL